MKLPYEPVRYIIDSQNIDNFKLSRFKRCIRESHVNDIKDSLDKGEHFHMPLAVFKNGNNGYKLSATTKSEAIDGNHRLSAIKKWLNENPNKSIEVLLMVYKINKNVDVTVRKIFHNVNIGRKQSTDDYIRAYKDTIPIFDMICGNKKVLPCSIYGNRDEMKFYHIVGAYLSAKENIYKGTWTGKPKEFVDEVRKLNDNDVNIIKEFWGDFCKMFSLKGVQNIRNLACAKTTGFSVIFFLWYHNKNRLGRQVVITKIRDKLADSKFFDDWARSSGISNSKKALDAIVRYLNKSVTKHHFYNQ